MVVYRFLLSDFNNDIIWAQTQMLVMQAGLIILTASGYSNKDIGNKLIDIKPSNFISLNISSAVSLESTSS